MSEFKRLVRQWALMVENGTLDLDERIQKKSKETVEAGMSIDDILKLNKGGWDKVGPSSDERKARNAAMVSDVRPTKDAEPESKWEDTEETKDKKKIKRFLPTLKHHASSLQKRFTNFYKDGLLKYRQEVYVDEVINPNKFRGLEYKKLFMAGNETGMKYDHENAFKVYSSNSYKMNTTFRSSNIFFLRISFGISERTSLIKKEDIASILIDYYNEVKSECENEGLVVLDMELYIYNGPQFDLIIPFVRTPKANESEEPGRDVPGTHLFSFFMKTQEGFEYAIRVNAASENEAKEFALKKTDPKDKIEKIVDLGDYKAFDAPPYGGF